MDYEKTTSMRCSEEFLDEIDDRKDRSESYEEYLWTFLERPEGNDPVEAPEPRATAPAPAQEPEIAVDPTPVETNGSPLDHIDLPADRDRDDCEEAIRAAREFIVETNGARKAEIVREIMPEYPLGYDAEGALEKLEGDGRYRGAWWRRIISPGLAAFDDVQKPAGGNPWRVT